ncbi:TPA: hypothetical protein HA246_03655 [Candidatus Woesearchaeota archaeon]|nr:hypothetical protein [Candidatus Woesearchaeota archaeon]
MADQNKQILEKLSEIKTELDYIKDHLVDVDAVLTEDDLVALQDAESDLKIGKTKRLI